MKFVRIPNEIVKLTVVDERGNLVETLETMSTESYAVVFESEDERNQYQKATGV